MRTGTELSMPRLTPAMSLILTVAFICAAIIVPAPSRGAVTNLELIPGQYTGTNVYVPGEIMNIVLHGDVAGEEFDLFAVFGEETLIPGGPAVIPSSGSIKISYELPNVADGNYFIRAKYLNGALAFADVGFTVQGYSFKIETDRDSYLTSDEIRVFWTANNLKDQTLPASGVGRIQVWTYNPLYPANLTLFLGPHRFNTSAGSVSFEVPPPPTTNLDWEFFIDGWFNNSATSPIRSQYSRADFNVKRLGVIINTDKDQYTVNSLLRLTMMTIATDNQANPSANDTGEPDCNVSVEIKKVGDISPIYGPITLMSDSQGILKHIIALSNESYVDGAFFELKIEAFKGPNDVRDSRTFQIVSSSSISIVMDFNRAQYASGEPLFVNATASAIGDVTSTNFTYIMEIRAMSADGSLFARETRLNGNFSFAIPSNFEGVLWVRVTVDDGAGNTASVIQIVSVAYAIVLVNTDKDYYNPNDALEVTYSVIGNMYSEVTLFYAVYDSEGNVVEEGATADGSFHFQVPSAPSSIYRFTVYASAGGRVVQGTDQVSLFSGFLLNLEFNRAYYAPGDIIAADYTIIFLGNANPPSSFTISYGLVNGPIATLQTTETSGTLIYTVPDDVDQGNQIFMATCNFGTTQASSSEVLVVQSGSNPLWYLTISDIPIFSIGILLLVLLALYVSLKNRKKLKTLEAEGLIKGSGESTLTKRVQDTLSHQVDCVECGNAIEITTTRRPIEVMCPHCGEIQHIDK
ncbi:MAG: hypothetical protein PHU53_02525 [Thermoplasmata archaeon]|nr:hypothetical protein [Thermoplasmata archaeon]